MSNSAEERDITERGCPGDPTGEAGAEMLARMNGSHAEVTAWGLGFLALRRDSRVLDIGCGGGACLHKMAQTVTRGHLTGLDHSAVSVAQSAQYNAAAVAAGKMEICAGSVGNMPFADGSFDRIVTVESFYFWSDPPHDLREVFRVLAPGGRFVIIADICGGSALTEHERENIEKYGLYNPTPEEFRTLLTDAGFSPVLIHRPRGKNWIAAEGRKTP